MENSLSVEGLGIFGHKNSYKRHYWCFAKGFSTLNA